MSEQKFFIDEEYINKTLESAKGTSDEEIQRILDKASQFKGLTHIEVASLMMDNNSEHIEKIFEVAGKIKEHIYGDRIVMFAPIYISDYCVNKCAYCGFRCDNEFSRRKLTMDEVREEVRILEKMGHKRLALEAGEDPVNCDIDYVLEVIKTIYNMKFENGEIRRVNVNIAATTVDNYKKLHEAQIGTYILFQETYHRETYERVHIAGPKKDYIYHTTAFDRAQQGGIEDVGGGVLFGFYKPEFEIMGLMLHNEHLEEEFGVGFHTISVPRMCKAEGADMTVFKHLVDDDQFLKIVAIIRMAVPFTGMIVSTRESVEMRKKLIKIGISQVSAGSSVDVGGYSARENGSPQFVLNDSRDAGSIIDWLLDEGTIPSFCTACYRQGRTGDRFMSLAKSGDIKNVCLPNALITLAEYAADYGNEKFNDKAHKVIKQHLDRLDNEQTKSTVEGIIKRVKNGERDIYL